MRLGVCSDCQSQFCARKDSEDVSQDMAVQPSVESGVGGKPYASSVRTLRARMVEMGWLEPAATPESRHEKWT